ncbi:hypothetical protein MEI_01011 [Bartonella vinsonii subsp. arupensis Pm136co]|uniref:Uncharacterized protein n=1 Tax=Bartonella vinsonii subsp. arupensis Pm136co TaxID=1094561 RepID=A0ABN0GP27_BARVI|nr:BID domain-containing T4SS effector [Bartonella vinsonii]EJF97979.1 hypothetical protein MEI_01011 [Bartonella vinsonii subsp. arupensis Pm136co]
MKKHQAPPSPPTKPEEPLYAKVNKSGRGQQQQPVQSEGVVYADLSFVTGSGQQQPEDPVYADLNFDTGGGQRSRKPAQPVESVYSDVSFGAGGGQHPQRPKKPEESVYATVSTGSGGASSNPRKGREQSPPRTTQDLLVSGLAQNPDFQSSLVEIHLLCKTVYGTSYALNTQLSTLLQSPNKGDGILRDLLENPEGSAKLAGTKVLGIKSPARKEAEDGFLSLCDAFEKHVKIAQKVHLSLVRDLAQKHAAERGTDSPEHHHHHHHHHHRHHERGREQSTQQQQQAQQRKSPSKGVAYAM